jgi:prepilin-type N-terminal cleavage/methylation domain-containing protein
MKSNKGITLIEMLVVLLILSAIAGVTMVSFASLGDTAKDTATRHSLRTIAKAIMGTPEQAGYWANEQELPTFVADLFDHADKGPYLQMSSGSYAIDAFNNFTVDYGSNGDPTVVDGWGNPIVLQIPTTVSATEAEKKLNARLVSAGPDGEIDTPLSDLTPTDLSVTDRDDDIIYFLRVTDS